MPETSVARINTEINTMLSGQVVEGNLSPDGRWGRITEFSCEFRLQSRQNNEPLIIQRTERTETNIKLAFG